MRMVLLAAALAAGFAGAAVPALGAGPDGNWRVVIITEQGDCDRAYGYDVAISQGRVRYAGEGSFDLSGTVSPNGAVKVSVSKGSQRADGTGKLGAHSGSGRWHGVASTGSCSGSWQAERR